MRELAEDLDGLYAKAKSMLPSEDGVPLEEVSVGAAKKKRTEATINATKEQSNTVPPPLQTHGAKKHPAHGRYGAKAEWQRKLIGQKKKSSRPARPASRAAVKRPARVVGGPNKKKPKLQADDNTSSTAEPSIDSTRDGSANISNPVLQASIKVQATTTYQPLPGNAGSITNNLIVVPDGI